MINYWASVFLIIFTLNDSTANTCHKTASVQRWVAQNGFHRTLHTRVQIPWNLTSCLLLLEEKFPAGVFVDPDELNRDLESRSRHMCSSEVKVQAAASQATHCTLGRVDVEAFEPGSRSFRVYSYTQPLCQGQNEVLLSLPLHLRYHAASPAAKDGEVIVVQPSLLASCPYQPGEVAKSCPGWSEGPAPCAHCSQEMCDWIHLPFSSAQLELRIPVPVGNSDHGTFVMATTALTLVLATLFLLWTIQASAKKNR